MIDKNRLKDLLAAREYNQKEKILLCLAVDNATPKSINTIRNIATSFGLRVAKKWNIAQILSKASPFTIKTTEGWELTTDGRKKISEIAGPFAASPVLTVASSLRKHLQNFTDVNTKKFIEESIECYEANHYRAAVVLSWVGAVSALQTFVFNNRLLDFNNEAIRRDSKWKLAKSTDDLSRMKESEFLNILEGISIIGKNVKQELENCLKLRNSCGHPNSLVISDNRVAAHIEILILNVFAQFY